MAQLLKHSASSADSSRVTQPLDALPDDEGMSLIEVIAAMVVFAISATAISTMLFVSLTTARTNRQRVVAAQLASKQLDNVRSAVSHGVAVPVGKTTKTTTLAQGTAYTVATSAEWTSLGQSGDACSGALTGAVAYQRVSATVTWVGMGSTKPIVNNEIITPPPNSLSSNAINIPVRVLDGTSAAVPGVAVTATSSSGAVVTGTTNDSGCVVFAQLAPGSYTVGLNTSGYVDRNGSTAHTESVSQSSAGTTPLTTVLYARPGTLTITPSASYQLPTAFKYSVSESSWTTNPTSFAANGSATLSGSAFPFTTATGSAYTAWAGTCTDSSGVSPSGFVTSSQTTSLLVPLANVTGTFTYSTSTTSGGKTTTTTGPLPAGTIISAKSACTDTYTWATGTNAFGVATFSLPYGSFTFSAVVGGKTYTAPSAVTVAPGTTAVTVSGMS